MKTAEIDKQRLLAELNTLAAITDAQPPAVTRVVYTAKDLEARAYIKQLCLGAGLTVSTDAIGNTFARWNGSNLSLAAVGTGSHIDAIPNAGMYDGTVGVLGGLEAIRALQRSGFKPTRSIDLIIFSSEEPTRFGVGCLGSRVMSGSLAPDAAKSLHDKDGVGLESARKSAGLEGNLEAVILHRSSYSHFIELHIEQGPLLEQSNIAVGVVTSIAAPSGIEFQIEGLGGHAGGMLMHERRDALAAAAALTLAIEHAALDTGSEDTVATVGICDVFPGAINSVPSKVRITADVRDTSGARRDSVVQAILHAVQTISKQRDVRIAHTMLYQDSPAACDEAIIHTIENSAKDLGFSWRRMISRAYHDSLFMAQLAPIGMIFIPCRDGVSHRPDEYSSPEAIAAGAAVLAESLMNLAK